MYFKNVTNTDELLEYLQEKARQNQKTSFVYHYTKLNSVLAILKTKKWLFGSPNNMNDGLELQFLEAKANNTCFISFLYNEKENLGMWSMYAQPWEDGVVIQIPISSLIQWINSKSPAQAVVRLENRRIDPNSKINKYQMILHKVVYTADEQATAPSKKFLSCGRVTNKIMENVLADIRLEGYVKHTAWAYENEVRLRIETDEDIHDGLLVDIPDDVLNTFNFITGPLFDKNLLGQIRVIDGSFDKNRIESSIFTGRLKWVYCQECKNQRDGNQKKVTAQATQTVL